MGGRARLWFPSGMGEGLQKRFPPARRGRSLSSISLECVQPRSCSFPCTAKEGTRKPRLFSAPAAQRVVSTERRQSAVTKGTLSGGAHP